MLFLLEWWCWFRFRQRHLNILSQAWLWTFAKQEAIINQYVLKNLHINSLQIIAPYNTTRIQFQIKVKTQTGHKIKTSHRTFSTSGILRLATQSRVLSLILFDLANHLSLVTHCPLVSESWRKFFLSFANRKHFSELREWRKTCCTTSQAGDPRKITSEKVKRVKFKTVKGSRNKFIWNPKKKHFFPSFN